MNFGDDTKPDLSFKEWRSQDTDPIWEFEDAEGLSILSKRVLASEEWITVNVWAYDSAARGCIYAIAEHCSESNTLELPYDRDGDRIPDAWERLHPADVSSPTTVDSDLDGVVDSSEDDERSASIAGGGYTAPPFPAGNITPAGVLGDGVVLFEEYRGFVIDRNFSRADPTVKDLWVNTTFGSSLFEFVYRSGELTGGKSCTVCLHVSHRQDEWSGTADRLINYNQTEFNSPQRAVEVVDDPFPIPAKFGFTAPSASVGSPLIVINAGANGICESQAAFLGPTRYDNQLVPFGAEVAPFSPCIDTGPDGWPDSLAGGDDVQVLGLDVSLTPNETRYCLIFRESMVHALNTIIGIAPIRQDESPGFQTLLKYTIAHELGHAQHMEHYWDPTIPPPPDQNIDPRMRRSVMYADSLENLYGKDLKRPLVKKVFTYDALDVHQRRLHLKHTP
jgi:hypothetical protein